MAEPTTKTVEDVAKDLRDHLDASVDTKVSEAITDDKLTEIVRGFLPGLLDDLADSDDQSAFIRKLRFAGQGDGTPELVGTKYARHGLGIGDIEFMYDVLRSAEGQKRVGAGHYGPPPEELVRTFDAVSPAQILSDDEAEARDRRAAEATGDPKLVREFERMLEVERAMDTAESGYGSSLVGAQYVGELWQAPRKLGRVFPLINSFEMTDATAYLPVEADLPEMLFVSESTANNSSNYDTVKTGSNRATVTAKKFVIHQMHSGELEEDSIIPFTPFLRMQAARSVAHYSDSLVLNGDTTNAGTGNINLDDADPADTKHYLAFDGIRHAALVDNTGNVINAGGALTYTDLVGPASVKALMVDSTYLMDWGHPDDPEQLVYVADPATADAISTLSEVLTVDKYGPNATVLTGEQARVGRHPLVSSIAVSKTEADGKVSTTAGNNTLGQVVAFHRGGFVAGWRRRVRTETERLPATDQTRVVHSLRLGLGRYSPTGAASGIEAAAVIRNITLS